MALTPAAITSALLLAALVGIVSWLLRGRRCKREKAAINAGWQRQVDAQQTESQRLIKQNSKLTSQLSAMQDATDQQNARVKQLDRELQNAAAQRDHLQQELQKIRSNLEDVLPQDGARLNETSGDPPAEPAVDPELAEKDRKIRRLKRELRRWQERVPPLVERYRQRDAEANEAAALHAAALARLAELDSTSYSDETRLEPLEESAIRHLDASNDQYDDTLAVNRATLAAAPGDKVQADNLKRIRGIGPAIERTLNRLGIFTYRQLASLSPAEVNRVADELRGFRSRIEREDWIGQALRLQQERDNA